MEILKIEDIEKLDRSFLTATEAARAMGISANTFRRHIADMDFPIVRFGRKIHVPKEPFLDFLRRGKCEKGKRGENNGV